MNAAAFQLNKVKRLINTQGRSVVVTRQRKNKFNEPNGEAEVFSVTGVFHETTSYLSKTGSDGSTVRSKPSPMLMCLWDDIKKLKHTDQIILNNHTYNIGEIKNLCEADVIGDISLEEVQTNGTSERL